MKKANRMKMTLLGLGLIFFGSAVYAENGLENILVEKYYISSADDITSNGGVLPAGSVTYRIYADMLPGYKFEAAYGVPDHELRIATSTSFFNNESGAVTPVYTKEQAGRNTVMLDSWLSVGAACKGYFGVMKTEDDGKLTLSNVNKMLLNEHADAGIPVRIQDGMMEGTPQEVTLVGFTPEQLEVFGSKNKGGNLFATTNAAWASLNGSVGPTAENRVLIAQVTTDGDLSFELNVQIGTPSGGVENYVAKNPVNGEISIPSLTYANKVSKPAVSKTSINTASSFNVYPNPSHGIMTMEVSVTNHGSYSVYDVAGKAILHNELPAGNCREKIDLSAFPKGQYLIEVTSGDVVSTRQVTNN